MKISLTNHMLISTEQRIGTSMIIIAGIGQRKTTRKVAPSWTRSRDLALHVMKALQATLLAPVFRHLRRPGVVAYAVG